MIEGIVRAIAICIIRNGDKIFTAEYFDPVKNEKFYRPIGGTIEFGEKSQDTVLREAREEIGAGLSNLKCLGVLENIFTYKGERGHEIVLVYEGDFADQKMSKSNEWLGQEDDGTPLKGVWKSLADFRANLAPLYPTGLFKLITESQEPGEGCNCVKLF